MRHFQLYTLHKLRRQILYCVRFEKLIIFNWNVIHAEFILNNISQN